KTCCAVAFTAARRCLYSAKSCGLLNHNFPSRENNLTGRLAMTTVLERTMSTLRRYEIVNGCQGKNDGSISAASDRRADLIPFSVMARAIGSGVLSFGLVSIPVEIHSAIQDQGIHFHLLHKKCGSRVRNQMICPVCNVVVERSDLVRGFELSKDNYVQLTEEELDSLEAEANNAIEFREFVPAEKIDPVYFESSYYLVPTKGAEKPY